MPSVYQNGLVIDVHLQKPMAQQTASTYCIAMCSYSWMATSVARPCCREGDLAGGGKVMPTLTLSRMDPLTQYHDQESQTCPRGYTNSPPPAARAAAQGIGW